VTLDKLADRRFVWEGEEG